MTVDDLEEACLEEIALEGLSGVTVSRLWILLEKRQPPFPLRCDAHTKVFLWDNLLCCHDSLSFYVVPTSPEVEASDDEPNNESSSIKQGKEVGSKDEKSSKRYVIYNDPTTNERGRCDCVKERKNVTQEVRRNGDDVGLSLDEVIKRYGDTLVVVASSDMRTRVLFQDEVSPDVVLHETSYAILERVGRARHQGVLQARLAKDFQLDPKSAFHFCKVLTKLGVVIKEAIEVHDDSHKSSRMAKIFLKRFRPVPQALMYNDVFEMLSEFLSKRHSKTAPRKKVVDYLVKMNESQQLTVKGALKYLTSMQYRKVIKLVQLHPSDLPPEDNEEMESDDKEKKERKIWCISLLENEADNDSSDAEVDDNDNPTDKVPDDYPLNSAAVLGRTYDYQIYKYIERNQTRCKNGVTEFQVAESLNLDKYTIRSYIKRQVKLGLLTSFKVEYGRRRCEKFVTKLGAESNKMSVKMKEMYQRLNQGIPVDDQPVSSDTQRTAEAAPSCITADQTSSTTPSTTADVAEATSEKSDIKPETTGQTIKQKRQHTLKALQRMDIILELVTSAKVVNLLKILKHMREVENKEGQKEKCCKKTLKRLVENLSKQGRLKWISTAVPMQDGNISQTINLITDPSITMDDPLINNAVHKARMKPTLQPKNVPKHKKAPVIKRCPVRITKDKTAYMQKYGYCGRMQRSEAMHKFIWYIVYGHRQAMPIRYEPLLGPDYEDDGELSQEEGEGDNKEGPEVNLEMSEEERLKVDVCQNEGVMLSGGVPKSSHPYLIPGSGVTYQGAETVLEMITDVECGCWDETNQTAGKDSSANQMAIRDSLANQTIPSDAQTLESLEEGMMQPTLEAEKTTSQVSSSGEMDSQPSIDTKQPSHPMGHEKTMPQSTHQRPESQPGKLDIEMEPTTGKASGNGGPKQITLMDINALEQENFATNVGVYMETTDWRRFVAPASSHCGFTRGWTTLHDIIYRMPLSLFVKVNSVVTKVPGLMSYLRHPIKRHYPIIHLPLSVREQLFQGRKYTFSLFKCLVSLSGMGLLYFTEHHKFIHKELIKLYVCQSGIILDTTTCLPAHYQTNEQEYARLHHEFHTFNDVEKYWMELRMICLGTPLGTVMPRNQKKSKEEKRIKHDHVQTKDRLMMISKNVSVAPPDPEEIPGDHRGAAGLDTTYYCHTTRCWSHYRMVDRVKKLAKKHQSSKGGITRTGIKDKGESKAGGTTKTKDKGNLSVKICKVSSKEHKLATVGGKGQKRKRPAAEPKMARNKSKVSPNGKDANQAKIKKAKKVKITMDMRRNKHISDEVDMKAKQVKLRRRVSWSPREDSLILLCSLALNILKRKCIRTRHFVPWYVVRNILHENLEESLDKTSSATAKRYQNILRNAQVRTSFTVCLTDIQVDKSIMSDIPLRTDDYEDMEVCEREFRELVKQLQAKFQSTEQKAVSIPSSLRTLHEMYQVTPSHQTAALTVQQLEAEDAQTREDIIKSVVHNIILISLFSHHHQERNMKQMFQVMQQYEPELLQDAFAALKSTGFVGRNRKNIIQTMNTVRALHFAPMSFQFTKAFFSMLQAKIPTEILTEAFSFLQKFKDLFDKEVAESGNDNAAVCINNYTASYCTLMCLSTTDKVCDQITIPKKIISLELSSLDMANLRKKHDEELKKGAVNLDDDDDDGDDGEDNDDPNAANCTSKDTSEESVSTRIDKMTKHLKRNATMDMVAAVHSAPLSWDNTIQEQMIKSRTGATGRMASLLPRLLINSQEGSSDRPAVTRDNTSQEITSGESSVSASHSFALDHDYSLPIARTGDTESDGAQRSGVDLPSTTVFDEEASSSSSSQVPDSTPVDSVKSSSSAPKSVEKVQVPHLKTGSFITWLNMRGLLTTDYSKKPQTLHEDIIIHRCDLQLQPSQELVDILKHNVFSTESSLPTSGDVADSERFQTLGEMVCAPCLPFQGFKKVCAIFMAPKVDYYIRSTRKSLDDVIQQYGSPELVQSLYTCIAGKGEVGVTYAELLTSLGCRGYSSRQKTLACVRFLLQEQLILELGVNIVRLVATEHAFIWLLKSHKTIYTTSVKNTTPTEKMDAPQSVKRVRLAVEASTSDTGVISEDFLVRDENSDEVLVHPIPAVDSPKDFTVEGDTIATVGKGTEQKDDEEMMMSGAGSSRKGVVSPAPAVELPQNCSMEGDSIATIEEGTDDNDKGEKKSDTESSSKGVKRKDTDASSTQRGSNVYYKPITFVGHMWTSIEGVVNRQTLEQTVLSIGLLIISQPGIKETDVFQHYIKAMSPVECLHIIKMLVNGGVITRHTTYTTLKSSLFNKPVNIKPTPVVFYQPTAECMLNLSFMQANLNRPT